jgi:hypothetical protein
MSSKQNAKQNHNIKPANKSFENVAQFHVFGNANNKSNPQADYI